MSKRKEDDHILVLCDEEEEYARLMTEFLRGHRDLPWEIHTYTDLSELLRGEQGREAALLVIAESAYREELQELRPLQMIILNESGCGFVYKPRIMPTNEPLKSLKAPYMARKPVIWGFFRLKSNGKDLIDWRKC